jgi:hypothetical protein
LKATQDGYIVVQRGVERGRHHHNFDSHFFQHRLLRLREFVGESAHQERIETAIDGRKVDSRIVNDPVVLAVRSGDKAVEAGGDGVHEAAHMGSLTQPAIRCEDTEC